MSSAALKVDVSTLLPRARATWIAAKSSKRARERYQSHRWMCDGAKQCISLLKGELHETEAVWSSAVVSRA